MRDAGRLEARMAEVRGYFPLATLAVTPGLGARGRPVMHVHDGAWRPISRDAVYVSEAWDSAWQRLGASTREPRRPRPKATRKVGRPARPKGVVPKRKRSAAVMCREVVVRKLPGSRLAESPVGGEYRVVVGPGRVVGRGPTEGDAWIDAARFVARGGAG